MVHAATAEWKTTCLRNVSPAFLQALGGASPAAAASPAPAAGLGGEPMFCGFGSPLKQVVGAAAELGSGC